MNYFEHKDSAKKRTLQLVVLLAFAVLALIFVTTLLISSFIYFLQNFSNSIAVSYALSSDWASHFFAMLFSPLGGWITLLVSLTVVIGVIYKFRQLAGGGQTIAKLLDAKPISPHSTQTQERKILNIVEEMAIASGNPVPRVFVIDCDSINAFAAGYSRDDAIIGVTNGSLEKLDRNELQAVIAHEFSHIYNGDMRLNMHLICLLHGILMIGLAGHTIAGNPSQSRRHRATSLAYLLIVVGYGGTFFGQIIKAAVNRQREFLADASSVQYTRDPVGLINALRKIAQEGYGSHIPHKRAEQFSHMYFCSAHHTRFMASLLATHPTVETRIKRISPRAKLEFDQRTDLNQPQSSHLTAPSTPPTQSFSSANSHTLAGTNPPLSNEDVFDFGIEHAGEITDKATDSAHQLIEGLPEQLYLAAHSPQGIEALLLSLITPHTHSDLNTEQKLTLIRLCGPTLKTLNPHQSRDLLRKMHGKIIEDKSVDLYEWCVFKMVKANFEPVERIVNTVDVIAIHKNIIQLLIRIAQIQSTNENHMLSAVNTALCELKAPPLSTLPSERITTYALLEANLNTIKKLKPLQQPALLKAIAAVIKYDHAVCHEEAALFRLIADSLGCPVPLVKS